MARLACALILCAFSWAFSQGASSQPYPSKPIRLVVPSPAGGAVDQVARLVAQKLGQSFGQPVVPENRAGANGIVAAEQVARSAADGYTLITGNASTHVSNAVLLKSIPYDPVKDFTPIAAGVDSVAAMAVHPSVPASHVAQFVEFAKRNAGKLSYGSAGTGSAYHLGGELFKSMAGLDLVHVPYKGLAPAMSDLIGGQIPMAFTALSVALPNARAGKVKLLAIVGDRRFEGLPDLPALSEAVPGYRKPATWVGFLGPAGLARPIVSRLNEEINKALNAPDVREKLDAGALVVMGGTPEEFAERIKADIADYARFAKAVGFQPE